MKLLTTSIVLLTSLLPTIVKAQGVLTAGTTQLPSCALSCQLLNQAAQACGGTTTADTTIWSCFCQSAYLTTLYYSPTDICDSYCTDTTDNDDVMTWYQAQCGTDDGASEHTASAAVTTVVSTSTSTPATTATSSATENASAASATTTSSGVVPPSTSAPENGSWWHSHYKWVAMLIVLFALLILIAIFAVWLKRRYDRKRDLVTTSFNPGITSRQTSGAHPTMPAMTSVTPSPAGIKGSNVNVAASGGRDTPVRTRDAFMPYGYAYSRSESRLGSRRDMAERGSPMARGATPIGDLENGMAAGSSNTTTPKSAAQGGSGRRKKVLVREISHEDGGSPS